MRKYVLVINPGSTSTKIAVFNGEKELFLENLALSDDQLNLLLFPDQYEIRKQQILECLEKHKIHPKDLTAIAARGGRIKPLKSGVYKINDPMVHDAKIGLQGEHPSNVAVVIANEFSMNFMIPAYTIDPISVDEMAKWSKITGLKEIYRNSLSHALNMKAAAKKAAEQLGKPYRDSKLIVAHLGGGTSISAHLDGKMVDILNSDKEGPFAVERAGALPSLELVELCYSGKYTKEELIKKLTHEGGLYSHFGTRDIKVILNKVNDNPSNNEIIHSYVYNITKSICGFFAVFDGLPDAIVITGGVIKSDVIRQMILAKLNFGIPVIVYPGEMEMESLAAGALKAAKNEIPVMEY